MAEKERKTYETTDTIGMRADKLTYNEILDHNDLYAKQDSLVSGSNIKTVNGESLLGNGDITVSTEGTISVDEILSASSSNAIQNKAVKIGLDKKQDLLTTDSLDSGTLDQGIGFAADGTLVRGTVSSVDAEGEIASFARTVTISASSGGYSSSSQDTMSICYMNANGGISTFTFSGSSSTITCYGKGILIVYNGVQKTFPEVSGDCFNPNWMMVGKDSDNLSFFYYFKNDTTKTTGTITGYIFEIYQDTCFTKGTLITLADGTKKPCEEITYDDELLTRDFFTGRQIAEKPLWIKIPQTSEVYARVTLEDGTVLGLVGEDTHTKTHRLYNVTKQKFMYPQDFEKDDVTWNEKGEELKIVSIEDVHENVEYYNIITSHSFNCYINGILASNRFSNMYKIRNNIYDTSERIYSEEEMREYFKKRLLPLMVK